jgi:hypothetical protein
LCCSIADMSGKNIAVLQVRLNIQQWIFQSNVCMRVLWMLLGVYACC